MKELGTLDFIYGTIARIEDERTHSRCLRIADQLKDDIAKAEESGDKEESRIVNREMSKFYTQILLLVE